LNVTITIYLLIGACFGLATFSFRYLFSEGPTRSDDSAGKPTLASRAFWLMLCVFLWPIMVITGIHSIWILAKRRRQARLAEHG